MIIKSSGRLTRSDAVLDSLVGLPVLWVVLGLAALFLPRPVLALLILERGWF